MLSSLVPSLERSTSGSSSSGYALGDWTPKLGWITGMKLNIMPFEVRLFLEGFAVALGFVTLKEYGSVMLGEMNGTDSGAHRYVFAAQLMRRIIPNRALNLELRLL